MCALNQFGNFGSLTSFTATHRGERPAKCCEFGVAMALKAHILKGQTKGF